MGFIDTYRNARQGFRNATPQWLRAGLKGGALPIYGAEQAVGAFISGPGQTGGDYIPSMLSHASEPTNNTTESGDGSTYTKIDLGGNSSGGGTGTGGSGSGSGSGTNIADFLNLINSQRGILQGQYNSGYTDTNANAGRSAANIQTKASQNIYDINQNMADAERVGAENSQTVRTGADAARYNTKQGITNNFSARGAIDSTYFQRAMDAGLGDINNQEKAQLTAITQALDKARGEATKQKNSIQMDLNIALQDLEAKRVATLKSLEDQYNNGMISLAQMEAEADAPITRFASPEELNKVQALADTNFQVDQYISNIDSQAQAAIDSIKTSAGQTQQAGVDLNNVTQLLGSLSKGLKAGYRKSDFVPLLVSKGYTPEQAQSILDRAELYGQQVTTNAPAPQPA